MSIALYTCLRALPAFKQLPLTFYKCNEVQYNLPGRTRHSLWGFETRTLHCCQLLFTL